MPRCPLEASLACFQRVKHGFLCVQAQGFHDADGAVSAWDLLGSGSCTELAAMVSSSGSFDPVAEVFSGLIVVIDTAREFHCLTIEALEA